MTTRLHWLLHNCVGHPLAGLAWFFGADKVGDWLHGATLPMDGDP